MRKEKHQLKGNAAGDVVSLIMDAGSRTGKGKGKANQESNAGGVSTIRRSHVNVAFVIDGSGMHQASDLAFVFV